MIRPRTPPAATSVAGHYDALDEAYRRVWGEHVHHGLWRSGRESPEQAARALSRHVADRAGVHPGDEVCDVGCGYGATARLLARERGARVTGLTLSPAQAAAAPPAEGVRILVGDWLANELPDAAFDRVIAVESLSHMPDKAAAFAQIARVARPGARVVLVDWLAGAGAGPRAERLLLEPICREGRLPSLHTSTEYASLMREAGLAVTEEQDLTPWAVRTWTVVAVRLARLLATDAALRRALASRANPELAFGLSLLRIPVAQRTGALRLGLIAAERTD